MIETKVPKDIRSYDIRVAGPLTIRQLLLLILAIFLDLGVYSLILGPMHISIDVLIYVVIFLDLPILAFTVKPMGMKMEQYLREIMRCNFLPPTNRIVSNEIVKKNKMIYSSKERKKTSKLVKRVINEHPEYKAYQ